MKDVLRYKDFIGSVHFSAALLGISLNQLVQRAVEKEVRGP